METSSVEHSSQQKTAVTKRYWKRLEEPSGGWWPWGWLPLLGLLLTLLYGLFISANKVEDTTQERVASALVSAGHSGFEVTADGQRVTISGVGPSTLRPQLEAIGRGTVCDTWIAKDLICPTRVTVDLIAPKTRTAPVQAVERASAPAPKPLTARRNRLHDFSITKNDEGLLLQGEVPNESIRNRLVIQAQALSNRVTDEMTVSGEIATSNYSWASAQMLRLLPQLTSGGFAWTQGKLSGSGMVDADLESAVRAGFERTDDRSLLGDLSLQVLPSAANCTQKFATALNNATIEFRTSSATISSASQPLLRRLAELARECPIRIDVEGHTDSRGAAEMNLALSRARAEAVVKAMADLGVDTSRMRPIGYGPSQPIADNNTAQGRAKNRRIEIKASAN